MAWAHVQNTGATATGGAGGTQALAYTSGNTAGSLLVACIHCDRTDRTITSVTDTQGNTWANATALTTLAALGGAQIWFAPNCAAGANTVTVTYSGAMTGNSLYLVVLEYSGIDTASPLDVTSTGQSAVNSATPTSGSATTTAANDLVVGLCYGGGTSSAAATFTSRNTTNGDMVEDKNQATAASVAATFTQSPSRPYIAHMATFKEPTGGGATTYPQRNLFLPSAASQRAATR